VKLYKHQWRRGNALSVPLNFYLSKKLSGNFLADFRQKMQNSKLKPSDLEKILRPNRNFEHVLQKLQLTAPRPFLNPACSSRRVQITASCSLFSSTLLKTLPGVESSVIPRQSI